MAGSPSGAGIPSRAFHHAGAPAPLGRRSSTCALLALLAGLGWACSSWEVPDIPPREVVLQQQPGSIQVVRTDSSRVELRSPRIVGDSLVGLPMGSRASASDSPHLAIALTQVSQVAIRRVDPVRTSILIGMSLLSIFAILFAVAFGQALSMWYEELAETED